MADDDAEVVRRYFEAWNRRDLPAMEQALATEARWVRSAEFPEGRTLEGRDSILDFARSMFDVFAESPIELERCAGRASGRVIVAGTSRFKGGRSGVETSASWVRVYEVRGGRIVLVRPAIDADEGPPGDS